MTGKYWKLLSNFAKNHSHVTALKIAVFFKKNCNHFLKFTIIFVNFASLFEFCSYISKVAVRWFQILKKLQSHLESCSHVIADFEIWLQNDESCSHISNYDLNFQHFAVTFRIMTAKCWNLQSYLGLSNYQHAYVATIVTELKHFSMSFFINAWYELISLTMANVLSSHYLLLDLYNVQA